MCELCVNYVCTHCSHMSFICLMHGLHPVEKLYIHDLLIVKL